ncbi:MAG: glycosyltransferase family 39 protein [Candidatus Acidiferrum sp.]
MAAEESAELVLEASQGRLSTTATWWSSGTAMVVYIAAGTIFLHLATGWRYGFDRDELMALEDARHLAWGYVQYPPMTPFFGRLALSLFGTSLLGFRFFAGVVQAVALVLTGLMAKELGGGKWAQAVATLAGVPFCLGAGALMQYISFDYVCWVLVAYCMIRLLKTDDSHWWLAVGAGIGLGMMSKYTMGFFALGVVAGILLTSARRYLKTPWLWLGVLLPVLIFLPNFLWEWKRNFVSLDFLHFLHLRDVSTGLTNWFLPSQIELTLLAFPLAVIGLYFYLFADQGRPFRPLAWMYLVPLLLLFVMRGRDYYLAPAYPMLYAAGAVCLGNKLRIADASPGRIENRKSPILVRIIWAVLILDVLVAAAVALPLAPVGSRWWRFAARVDTVFPDEIGWPQFVQSVAQVRDQLTPDERAHLGILAGNYGEVGALNLYGGKLGLPRAISGVNSSWERGYGDPPPETLIVIGYPWDFLEQEFSSCDVAAKTWNRFGIANEETAEVPDIYVCRGLKTTWPEFWAKARRFA